MVFEFRNTASSLDSSPLECASSRSKTGHQREAQWTPADHLSLTLKWVSLTFNSSFNSSRWSIWIVKYSTFVIKFWYAAIQMRFKLIKNLRHQPNTEKCSRSQADLLLSVRVIHLCFKRLPEWSAEAANGWLFVSLPMARLDASRYGKWIRDG